MLKGLGLKLGEVLVKSNGRCYVTLCAGVEIPGPKGLNGHENNEYCRS